MGNEENDGGEIMELARDEVCVLANYSTGGALNERRWPLLWRRRHPDDKRTKTFY